MLIQAVILSFYSMEGELKESRQLDFEPHCIKYCIQGEYLLIGGSDRKLKIYTRTGKLGEKDKKLLCNKKQWEHSDLIFMTDKKQKTLMGYCYNNVSNLRDIQFLCWYPSRF